MAIHPEHEAEQRHIDRAYAVLDRARGATSGDDDVVPDAEREEAGGTHQQRNERFAEAAEAQRRADHLRFGDAPLVFGRIDLADSGDHGAADPIETFYVGRIGVSDAEGDPLVVDWRAPISEAFYRATGVDPMGLRRRRAFHCRGRRLLGLDDEYFDFDDLATQTGLVGEAALLASLDAPRSGQLQDVVATVQAEQDEVIRGSLSGIAIVQGAAGTGKTVVALHRAAYLLYTWRHLLERQGVLVLGPNSRFLDYVRDVLPSLGEHSATLATVADLHPGIEPVSEQDLAVATVKGDLRMARVIRRAVRTRQRPLVRTIEVPFHRYILRIEPDDSRQIVAMAKGRDGTHNQRRVVVEEALYDHLFAQYERRVANRPVAEPTPTVDDRWGDDAPKPTAAPRIRGRAAFAERIAKVPAVREALERIWPRLSAEELLVDLFGGPALLARACRGVLDEHETDRLKRERPAPDVDPTWTDADVPLLQEAHALLGPKFPLRRVVKDTPEDVELLADRVIEQVQASLVYGMDDVMEADIRRQVAEDALMHGVTAIGDPIDEAARTYGHVLVDEAQDLSPMAWRMIGRRCPNQSMTIVGDLAQGTAPWSAATWDSVAQAMSPRHPPRRHDLHVNYRLPAEIVAATARLRAAVTGEQVADAQAVRRSGRPPEFIEVVGAMGDAVEEAATALADEFDAGKVAVVVSPTADLDLSWADRHGIAVHTSESAKGLEFDGVVVVDPRSIWCSGAEVHTGVEPSDRPAGRDRGLAGLYVAMTRATQHLVVVHGPDLPAVLQPPAAADRPTPVRPR